MAAALTTLLVALALAAVAILAGRGPVSAAPRVPFEGGERTGHTTWVQFRTRYALVALVFVAFDMEMVYMFPWAVVFRRLGLLALLDMFVFLAVLISALAFAWKEGALDWER